MAEEIFIKIIQVGNLQSMKLKAANLRRPKGLTYNLA